MSEVAQGIYERLSRNEIDVAEAFESLIGEFTRPAGAPETFPLSQEQAAIWMTTQYAPEKPMFNIPYAIRAPADFDFERFKHAFDNIVRLHPALRTTLRMGDDGPVQSVSTESGPGMERVDASGFSEAEIMSKIKAEAYRPFDLESGFLMRGVYFDGGKGGRYLLFVFHHMIFDGMSLKIFLEDLFESYGNEETATLPASRSPAAGYRDFVKWQADQVAGPGGEQLREYWRGRLSGELSPLMLPMDNRPPLRPTYSGDIFITEVGKALSGRLDALAAGENVSLFTVLMSLFQILLFRYSGNPDILVVTPVAGRSETRFERVIGCFMNPVVIRNQVDGGAPFREHLERVEKTVIEALDHADYPFLSVIRDLGKTDTSPLFQTAFYFQNWLDGAFGDNPENGESWLPGPLPGIHQTGEFYLTLEVIQYPDNLVLQLKYNPDVFSAETIEKAAGHYISLLTDAVSRPGRAAGKLRLLTPAENRVMTVDWNDTAKAYPGDRCVHELLREQATKTPDATALIFEDQVLTYRQLDERTDVLAAYLRGQGIKPGVFAGIFLKRSTDLFVGILAVLKAGGAYVPLDPLYPGDRLAYMFKDSNLRLVITHSDLKALLPTYGGGLVQLDREWASIEETAATAGNDGTQHGRATPDDLAYLIYTSGSTGKPKGVQIHHRGLTNLLWHLADTPGFTAEDKILAITTISFDMAVPEVYLALVTGGSVEIVSADIANNGVALKEKLERSDATVLQATPTTWQMLLAAEWAGNPRASLWCGGEAMPDDLAAILLGKGKALWNLFGPTETTVWSSAARVEPGRPLTIGRPFANTRFYILDGHLNPVPVGVEGYLYIGGDGVAKGYLNRPNLTREKFVPDPFDEKGDGRIYNTGDLARYTADGSVVFIGRADNQIKIRGFRIELSEIEATLKRMPGIKDAVAVVREDRTGHKMLAAYWIPDTGETAVSPEDIKAFLGKWLPHYMIPARYARLARFPMTPTRKVDRKPLANDAFESLAARYGEGKDTEPSPKRGAEHADTRKPRESAKPADGGADLLTRFRGDLRDVIAGIAGVPSGDMDTERNLGEYGYDSLRFTTLSTRLKRVFSMRVNPARFFENPTLESLSAYLIREHGETLASHYGEPFPSHTAHLRAVAGAAAEKSEAKRHSAPRPLAAGDDVAIIGMSGVMPGSDDLAGFWDNLVNGRDVVGNYPEDRIRPQNGAAFPFDLAADAPLLRAGYLRNIDVFDPRFFGITPVEGAAMDPQQRLFLTTVWRTIEDAGYKASDLAATMTGVFVGVSTADYRDLLVYNGDLSKEHLLTGLAPTIVPNRISYQLNLRGPSVLVDTACSSSLIAIHRGVHAIQTGECELAVAGGVNLLLSPLPFMMMNRMGMLSPSGRCRTFDRGADGYVRGEGAGAVLLKPLSRAEADGDHIYTVIRASGENHGGRANSLTAPNPDAQADLIASVWRKAGVPPGTATYIETHGTGTSLGDPVEIIGLRKGFDTLFREWGTPTPESPRCGLGSVKSAIGHLEGAAGVAGVIKVILAMTHGALPGNLHYRSLNPNIELDESPFFIESETRKWVRLKDESGNDIPRRAGISSFGVGGSNAHIVLDEYRPRPQPAVETDPGPQICVLSAKNPAQLGRYARDLLTFIEVRGAGDESADIRNIAHTLQNGREEMRERLAVVARDVGELTEKLRAFVGGAAAKEPAYFVGDTRNGAHLGHFLGGEEGRVFIRELARRGKLDKLAELWTTGVAVNWRGLADAGEGLKRVPLPGYPFEKGPVRLELPGGQPVAARVTCNAAPENAGPAIKTDTADEVFHCKAIWLPHDGEPDGRQPIQGDILVFESPGARICDALGERARNTGGMDGRVVRVAAGERFRRRREGHYEIRPDHVSDYHELFGMLTRDGVIPRTILHLWSAGDFSGDAQSLNPQLGRSVHSLFHLVRERFKGESPGETQLVYAHFATSGAYQPHYEAVSGFLRSVAREIPDLRCKSLGLDTRDPSATTDLLLRECRIKGEDMEIRYDNGVRMVRRFVAAEGPPASRGQDLPLREGGVYLVTGGCGRLGALVAEHMGRRIRGTLVLADFALDATRCEEIGNRIRVHGAHADFIRADLSRPTEVAGLVETIRERYHGLNGVIHCAGVVRDAAVMNKTFEDFQAVVGPKVFGAAQLDAATREEALDFFACFSSIAGVWGNHGQSDYAYANSFLNHFAEYRESRREAGERSGRTVSISWPHWEAGGMAFSPAARAAVRETYGITSLKTETGLALFDAALRGGVHRPIVVVGDRERFHSALGFQAEEAPIPPPEKRPDNADGEDESRLAGLLVNVFSERTSIPAGELPLDLDFSEIGIDSVLSLKIIQDVERLAGVRLHINELAYHNTLGKLARHLATESREKRAGQIESTGEETERPSRPVIFILSTPRAGSTLLRVMMAGHGGLFAPPELHLLNYDTLQERNADMAASNTLFFREGLMEAIAHLEGLTAGDATRRMAEWEEKDLSVREVYRLLQITAGERRLVDKSPTYAVAPGNLEKAELLSPKPYYIHLVRHPAAVVESFVRNRFHRMHDIQEEPMGYAGGLWLEMNRNISTFLSGIEAERWIRIRYEDMVEAPEATLLRVCEKIGIPFEDGMLDPYGEKRMTSGLHDCSLSLGDPNFLNHDGIDPALADAWRNAGDIHLAPDVLNAAETYGYRKSDLSCRTGHADEQNPREAVAGMKAVEEKPVELSLPQRAIFQRLGNEPCWGTAGRIVIRAHDTPDIDRLQTAMTRVYRRHPVLRRYFSFSDGKWSQFEKADIPADFQCHDLRSHDANERQRALTRIEEDLIARIDPRTPPLLRVAAARIQEDRLALILAVHMLIADGYAMRQVVTDFIKAYRRPTDKDIIPDTRYDAYTRAVNRPGEWCDMGADLEFWKKQIPVRGFSFPEDMDRGLNLAATERRYVKDRPLHEGTLGEAFRHGMLFFALSAGLYRFLARRAGGSPPIVAHRFHRRNIGPWKTYTGVVGRFAGDVPIGLAVTEDGDGEGLMARFQTALEAIPHAGVTYEMEALKGNLPQPREITDVLLNYQDLASNGEPVVSWESRQFHDDSRERMYGIELIARKLDDTLRIIVAYSNHRHRRSTMKVFVRDWLSLAAACADEWAARRPGRAEDRRSEEEGGDGGSKKQVACIGNE